ncbi:DEAD/DEAH box helicase [Roseovarius salinarum]|uniref:DEAD/DEAH box helicase n=1 Tax=Roseovarius salinarum TaxID=1981892 RepID=UPI000C3288B8|nr:DEAD/DEAH box helicase [Roseovarius salinarum]
MTKFSDLNLNPKVLKAVEEAGYETPTPIQEGAIPPALEGRDVLGIAQTGTGKTAGFTLPMLSLLARGRARARMPRSLVLCPTRELAAQVAENFDTYSRYLKLSKALLIGGVSFKEQDKLIDKGVDVLIATPGRLLDHFERGKLILSDVKVMVVDEADRMLDMGFIPDIERIFGLTPFTRQTLFFSATMAPEIERITNTFLQAPVRIEVARQATASETIEQRVVMFKGSRRDREDREKRDLLRALIDGEGDKLRNAIIFCNRKADVDVLAKSLKKHGYDAAPIHGDLDQSQRTKTLDGFRDGSLRLLIASDVAARGLDIPDVSHVINYDVPGHAEDYVHRIGRTGRAGREGTAITICTPRDEKSLDGVEKLLEKDIPRADNPLGSTVPAEAGGNQDTAETDDKPRKPRRRKPSKAKGSETKATEGAQDGKTDQDATPAAAATESRETADTGTAGADKADAEKPKPARGRRGGKRKSEKGEKGGDEAVVGMGDHMPKFIALSFEERRAG